MTTNYEQMLKTTRGIYFNIKNGKYIPSDRCPEDFEDYLLDLNYLNSLSYDEYEPYFSLSDNYNAVEVW